MLLAGVILREFKRDLIALPLAHDGHDRDPSVGKTKRRLDRIGKARADIAPKHEAVDDDLNGMSRVLLKTDLLGKIIERAVNARAHVAASLCLCKNLLLRSLLRAHDRGKHEKAASLGKRKDPLNDAVERQTLDRLAADRAVWDPDARVEQAQIIVDLGHGADRRARVLRGRLLVDRDRGGKSVDRVNVGLIQLTEEHSRISRERLDKSPMPLGVEGVKGERGLPRARQSR